MKSQYFLLLTFYFSLLTFSYSQTSLKVNKIFGDHMVIQRGCKIPVWGTSNPDEKITIECRELSLSTTADSKGNWKIVLPAQEIGIPFELKISLKDKSIIFKDILIGEVWFASGQSNMHLDLNRTLNGKEVAAKANNPNIRIYNMKPTYPTGKDGVHTLEELDSIQNNKYFNTKGWVKVSPDNVLYFSAVAYYFSEKLQGELNVPVGIIHNAVPGSPIESWMSEKSIKNDSVLTNFVEQRWKEKEEEKDAMISIAKKQISLSKIEDQKHPWMPSYNYENGILPIKDFPVKGVIWYQGESNAELPAQYKTMFKKMVKTWRNDWKNNFPFYYVQLTSREDRPAWPAFRNAQRELLEIVPNSGMVVITDVGDRQDTHAKNKKPVGERLALLALGDSYHKGANFESPVFKEIYKSNGDYFIRFKGSFEGLKTSDNKEIIGFEISENGKDFIKITPKISGNSVRFTLPEPFKAHFFIRYAWEPYTEANLVSKNGLPVSSFSADN
ncbi:MAG: sialate O-acetylesterase [Bacteroidota bacterium]